MYSRALSAHDGTQLMKHVLLHTLPVMLLLVVAAPAQEEPQTELQADLEGALVVSQVMTAVATELQPEDMFPFLDLFASCVAIVQSDYADAIDPTNLIYGALHGMLRSLDPHSEFMEPAAVEDLKADTEGEYGGLGIEIGIRDEYITVIAPIEDTPAFEAGLMPSDRIIRIEDKSTRSMAIGEAVKYLRGKPGTDVTITVQRMADDGREVKEVTITRAKIKVRRVRDARIIDATNGIAYVRVTAFDKNTHRTLGRALDGLSTQGMAALVLDLRNNGGGLLDSAIKLSDMFLEAGQPIVSTKGRIESQNRAHYSTGETKKYRMPIVLLVNGASASAAEIVCGALKDHRRAVVVGSKTFGKGSVQTVMPVGNDDCALRLTTAKYYTPSGVCIHGTGIYPNIIVNIPFEDEIKLLEKRAWANKVTDPETLTEEDRGKYDELIVQSDVQLDRAVDLLVALRFLSGSEYREIFHTWPEERGDRGQGK
jgi:carboxyl-terminal processing protease